MKNTKFLAFLLPLLGLLAAPVAYADVVNLIADGGDGTGFDVGDVEVWNDTEKLYVRFVTTGSGWEMLETHLHVAYAQEPTEPPSKNEVPQTGSDNPKIGKFMGKHEDLGGVTIDLYEFLLTALQVESGDTVYIAAHAVVESCNVTGLELALPDLVTVQVQYPYEGGPAYFPETTVSGGTWLDGVYLGWCIDTDLGILNNTPYSADVYSSYGTLPAGLLEFPENLDLVNWILNQNYVGESSPGGYGIYTYGDVQRAIWELLDDGQSTASIDPWSEDRVNEILTAAAANGAGFVPGCGDDVAIILVPFDAQGNQKQALIIKLNIQTLEETAWGDGDDFPGRNWAMYFTYLVQ
ncbi:MAG: hypothetical protein ACYS80_15590 [Planctomycetota bacterium]